jgi:hypothetical protein
MPHFIPRGPATPVNDFKESRTQLDNATNLGRKSGVPGTMMSLFSNAFPLGRNHTHSASLNRRRSAFFHSIDEKD